jgi:hypothetical protein
MDDMLRDIDNGLLSEKEMLPFGFTKDSAAKYQAYLTSLVSSDPAISDALRRRQEFQNHLKQSLVSAELLNESVLEDERYWHHQVLQYRAIKDMGEVYRGIGVSSDDIRLKKKGWQRKRSGSVMDYNTQYVEAEFEWVAQALAQLETRVIMDAIREKTDITKTLKALAKKRNLENFYAPILAGLPDGTTIEDIRGSDIDPLAGYGKSVARAVMALGRMASKNELHAGAEYEETIEALADWFQDEKERKAELEENYRFQMPNLMEEGGLFALLSHLMANDLPGAPWAGSVFKAVRGRANEIKKTLGDKYLTPKRLIKTDPEFADYTEWIPSPGQTWYKAWSIPDRLVAQVQAGEDVIDQEKIQKAQQILARGRDATWIVPNGIAKTLDGYDSQKSDSRIGRGLAAIQAAWKQWTLINPFRVVKYNLNNMSGDLDITFAYRPKIVSHYLPKAIADLYRDWKDLNMNQGLKDELDLAYALGVLGSGWSVQEVSDVAAQLKFKKHLEALSGDDPGLVIKILSAPKKVWRGMQGFTQYRENLLRFAAFRYFMDELQKGNRVYGASNWKEIDAMDPLEIDRKAAKMARELLGDYGNVTHAGQWLRRHIIPFYSWMEVNAPRYVRLMKNLRHEGQGTGSRGARMVGVVAGRAAWKTSKLALKMAGFYALAILWNRFIFPDEDDEMGEQQRRQLHLILGRRDDGSIVSIRIQGAFSDALSWFGMEDFPTDIANLISGKKGITDVAKDSALAAPTKIINSLGPQWKAPGEIISGRSFYPDPLNPMPIRDRYEYLARTMSLGSVYDWLMGRPKRGGQLGGMMIEELMAMALYKSDPGEMAYYDTTRMVREYNERRGKEMPSGDPTSKSNALYYYRKSLKVGDLTAAEKYLREYYSFPGTNEKSLAKSIDRSHPLGGLAKKDRPEFLKSLTPEELEAYRIALSWYNQTYKGAAHAEAKAAAKRPIVDDDEEESTSTLRFNR